MRIRAYRAPVSLRFLCYLLFAASCFNASAGELKTNEWGPETNGVRMRITLGESSNSGTNQQSLPVTIEITNVSAKVVRVMKIVTVFDYKFSGTSPTRKELIPKIPDTQHSVYNRVKDEALAPGGCTSVSLDLREIFDLNETGQYKFIARRKVTVQGDSNGVTECELVSNELTVTNAPAGELKTNEWGPVKCGAALSLKLAKSDDTQTTNRPVNVQIELWNQSTNRVSVSAVPPFFDIRFKVKTSDGKEVISQPPSYDQFSGGQKWLNRDEKYSVMANLMQFFRFNSPGSYTITAIRTVVVMNGTNLVERCDLVSNELKLVIP